MSIFSHQTHSQCNRKANSGNVTELASMCVMPWRCQNWWFFCKRNRIHWGRGWARVIHWNVVWRKWCCGQSVVGPVFLFFLQFDYLSCGGETNGGELTLWTLYYLDYQPGGTVGYPAQPGLICLSVCLSVRPSVRAKWEIWGKRVFMRTKE